MSEDPRDMVPLTDVPLIIRRALAIQARRGEALTGGDLEEIGAELGIPRDIVQQARRELSREAGGRTRTAFGVTLALLGAGVFGGIGLGAAFLGRYVGFHQMINLINVGLLAGGGAALAWAVSVRGRWSLLRFNLANALYWGALTAGLSQVTWNVGAPRMSTVVGVASALLGSIIVLLNRDRNNRRRIADLSKQLGIPPEEVADSFWMRLRRRVRSWFVNRQWAAQQW